MFKNWKPGNEVPDTSDEPTERTSDGFRYYRGFATHESSQMPPEPERSTVSDAYNAVVVVQVIPTADWASPTSSYFPYIKDQQTYFN